MPPAAELAAAGRSELAECHDCGLLQRLATAADAPHGQACRRCHASFGHGRRGLATAFPLLATGLVLFALAQSFPVMGIALEGLSQQARIESGPVGLFDHGLSPLALLVLVTSILAPLFRLLANFYVLGRLHLGRRPAHLAIVFRLSERLRAWSMLDVLLLGTLIAFTKLHDLAPTEAGVGLWALALLVLLLAVQDSLLDRQGVWSALPSAAPATAIDDVRHGAGCLVCGLFNAVAEDAARPERCARCRARLFRRKPDSIARTWALVLAGVILYLPANVYPALTVISFGRGEPSTILGGVIELTTGEDWPLALLIFTASVAVPVLKLVGLAALLLSTQFGLNSHRLDRTRLYRLIEFIGRWSMIDVFVAALLTALVTLGRVATIEPGPGILAFGAVVVVTMLAAESFDPRLIWDAAEVPDA